MQCTSCPYSGSLTGRKSAATPWLSGRQLAPASVLSKTPPTEMPTYRCRGSRGSTLIECRVAPPGGPGFSSPPIHGERIGLALKPATPSQVTPPSSERNRPGGETPAYHTPDSEACPGASQNTWSTASPFSPSAALGNAGGRCASFQVRPESV